MGMRAKMTLLAVLASVTFSALGAASAYGAVWKFNGVALSGVETVEGLAVASHFTVPGATTTCVRISLPMQISNSGGKGAGIVTAPEFAGCHAPPSCTVESVEAEKLPWPVTAVDLAAKQYVIVEGVRIKIVYGALMGCPYVGKPVTVTGTLGGLYTNSAGTANFNKATYEATGTGLKFGASPIEWVSEMFVEALGAHSGETLEIS